MDKDTWRDLLALWGWLAFYNALGVGVVWIIYEMGALDSLGQVGSGVLGIAVGCVAIVAGNLTAARGRRERWQQFQRDLAAYRRHPNYPLFDYPATYSELRGRLAEWRP